MGSAGVAMLTFPELAWAQQQAWERLGAAREVIGAAKPDTVGITLDLPLVSEDGSSVPLTVRVESPMSPSDYVQSVHLFASRNPAPGIATFEFAPGAGRAEVATRIRLNETQSVIAIARTSKGRISISEREVRVTTSGCLVRSDANASANEFSARVRVPGRTKRGAIAEIVTLLNHPMETGFRELAPGKVAPQRIINAFEARLDGEIFFKATLQRSLAANPYLRFFAAARETGQLGLKWTEDTGRIVEHKRELSIE